jgi:hypothetical protein
LVGEEVMKEQYNTAYQNLQLKISILTDLLKQSEGDNADLRSQVAYWKAKVDQGRGKRNG